MNKLMIYYSNSGNGDAVAERLKEQGYTLRKVTPKKPMPKSFFLQILAGGFAAGIGKKEPLCGYCRLFPTFTQNLLFIRNPQVRHPQKRLNNRLFGEIPS